MTDLYSKASLIFTANAYSASKAYAVKPSSGTGDFSFSRASASGSRITSNGSIQFVNSNVPRLTYTVQPTRTNFLVYSNDFSNGNWTIPSTGNYSLTSSAIISPDGTLNGWKLNESSSVSGDHYIAQSVPMLNNLITYSIFAKKAERSFIRLFAFASLPNEFTNYPSAYFNLTNGTVGTSANCNAKIESYGNDWYRCTIQATSILRESGSLGMTAVAAIANTNGNSTYAGTPGSGIYIYGAQLEPTITSNSTPYIPTTTTSASAAPSASSPSFLLEPQSTNLLIRSNGFGTTATWGVVNTSLSSSQITSPEGVVNGWKLNEIQDIKPVQSSTIFTNFSSSVTTVGGTIDGAACISSSIAAILGITTNVTFTIRQTSALSATANSRYICSAYVKPAERTRVAFQSNLTGDSNYLLTKFNLTGTGSVYSTPAGYTASISQEVDGWYRISTAATADSSTTKYFSIDLLSGSLYSNEYLGSNASGVYIYGAQIEPGLYSTSVTASSYIPTTTTTATRIKDVLSNTGMQSLGFCSNIWTVFVDYNVDNINSNGGSFLYLKNQVDQLLWYLAKTSTGIKGYDQKSGATLFSNVTSANASKIALTSDGTSIRVYVNGVDTGTIYTPSNSSTLLIDRIFVDSSDSAALSTPSNSTLIKNVIVYPTALSATECNYLTSLNT